MKRIKQIIKNPDIGIDAWYDSYMEDVTELLKEKISPEKIDDCFNLLAELTKNEKVKFFEAITEIQNIILVPKLFEFLDEFDLDIDLAEPIIDGLRNWTLSEKDALQLKCYALKYYGKSKILDEIISNLIKNSAI